MSTTAPAPALTEATSASPAYGISEWPDTDTLYPRLKELVRQPIRAIRRENMDGVLKYFDEKCRRSKQLAADAAEVIPGGIQHNLAFNYPFPLAMSSAKGAHFTDVDGNRYIDFLKAGGPTLLESNNAVVRQKIHELLDDCGPVTGVLHEYEVKIAQVVREAITRLPHRWQRLMEMLMSDPPASYAEISDELGLPVGSIGPTRGRCLARLRMLLEAAG